MSTPKVIHDSSCVSFSCLHKHIPDPDTIINQYIRSHGIQSTKQQFWQCKKCQLYFTKTVWSLFYTTADKDTLPIEITPERYREAVITNCL